MGRWQVFGLAASLFFLFRRIKKDKKKGVVSLKRGNSFLVQKKHSDYEKPNACGRM